MSNETWMKSDREWARLGIYGALQAFSGDPKREHITAKWIAFTIQRLAHEETGQLLNGVGMVDKIKVLLNPEQGSDLGDMGEWADWIIDSFLPRKRGNE